MPISGQVFKLYESRYGGGSFRLENDQTYYNTNKSYPLPAFVQPGALITFEAGELKGKGKTVADNSIVQASRASAPSAQTASSGGGGYQEGARYQGALERAILMTDMLIRHAGVKLSDNPAKRGGQIEKLVDRFTALYFEDTGELGALSRAEPEELPAAEPKAKTKNKPDPEPADDEDLDD